MPIFHTFGWVSSRSCWRSPSASWSEASALSQARARGDGATWETQSQPFPLKITMATVVKIISFCTDLRGLSNGACLALEDLYHKLPGRCRCHGGKSCDHWDPIPPSTTELKFFVEFVDVFLCVEPNSGSHFVGDKAKPPASNICVVRSDCSNQCHGHK